jgi:hypothetical protein
MPASTESGLCMIGGPYVVFLNETLRTSARNSHTQLCKKDAVGGVDVLFLHYGRRFGADFLIGSADSQRVHTVLEHPAADSQQVGGMGLDIVCSF